MKQQYLLMLLEEEQDVSSVFYCRNNKHGQNVVFKQFFGGRKETLHD